MLPKSWKKLFKSGVAIRAEMRFCNKGNDKKICDRFKIQINKNKEFGANLYILKTQPPS